MVKITQEEFDKLVNSRIEETKHLLLVKAKEYARNNDPLHNFNKTSLRNSECPAQSLHGMLSKHLTSYFDMLNDVKDDISIGNSQIKEKFGDIIVYFMLQEILFLSINENKRNTKHGLELLEKTGYLQ